jgi:hypothetical protein
MKKITPLILLFFTQASIAQNIAISRISESCLYDAQEKFAQFSEVKVNEFNAVITDGGGYGVYESFNVTFLPPVVNELSYDGIYLSTNPKKNDLIGLVELIQKLCNKTTNQ